MVDNGCLSNDSRNFVPNPAVLVDETSTAYLPWGPCRIGHRTHKFKIGHPPMSIKAMLYCTFSQVLLADPDHDRERRRV